MPSFGSLKTEERKRNRPVKHHGAGGDAEECAASRKAGTKRNEKLFNARAPFAKKKCRKTETQFLESLFGEEFSAFNVFYHF
jgi:hypothetical protein